MISERTALPDGANPHTILVAIRGAPSPTDDLHTLEQVFTSLVHDGDVVHLLAVEAMHEPISQVLKQQSAENARLSLGEVMQRHPAKVKVAVHTARGDLQTAVIDYARQLEPQYIVLDDVHVLEGYYTLPESVVEVTDANRLYYQAKGYPHPGPETNLILM